MFHHLIRELQESQYAAAQIVHHLPPRFTARAPASLLSRAPVRPGIPTPLGQTLIVTAGCGWTQCEGESIVEIRAGDVIWCPPGHKHWHGATPTTSMTHIAIQEALDGKNVIWMEHVTDEQYNGA